MRTRAVCGLTPLCYVWCYVQYPPLLGVNVYKHGRRARARWSVNQGPRPPARAAWRGTCARLLPPLVPDDPRVVDHNPVLVEAEEGGIRHDLLPPQVRVVVHLERAVTQPASGGRFSIAFRLPHA